MSTSRSMSYTRGVPTPPTMASTPFDPLDRISLQKHNEGLSYLNRQSNNIQEVVHCSNEGQVFTRQGSINLGQGSINLGQYRRHSASFAAPIRGSTYMESEDARTKDKRTRSSSWAPDSPKKMKGMYKSVNEGKKRWYWKILRRVEESKYFNGRILKTNKKEFLSWFMLACFIVVGYKFFSDGSFSAILTLASAFQCFALLLLIMKVINQQSVSGVSQRSLLLIIVCLISRLIATLFFSGYLPVDRSGDWVYQAADILSVGLILVLVIYGRSRCQASIQQQRDKDTCFVIGPVIVAFVLSCAVHPTLNQNLLADIAWTFALYVETFAMVPQLFMMGKLAGEVEVLTSHYVASMAVSKVFAFIFWYFSYNELASRNGGYNLAGWAVILSYSVQTLLFADFLYYYIKSIKIGRKMIINF